MEKPSFTSIVISGGAMKVVSTIGCFKYLEEQNMIQSIKNFVGTSAGSIICFFILLQYRSSDIINFMIVVPINIHVSHNYNHKHYGFMYVMIYIYI